MKRTSMQQLEQWHVQGQYQKIVEAIEAIDPTERGYELTGQLARAYNNLGQYERALTSHILMISILQKKLLTIV